MKGNFYEARARDNYLLANQQRHDQQIQELQRENADTRSQVGTYVHNLLPRIIHGEIGSYAARATGPNEQALLAPIPHRKIKMGEAFTHQQRPPKALQNVSGTAWPSQEVGGCSRKQPLRRRRE